MRVQRLSNAWQIFNFAKHVDVSKPLRCQALFSPLARSCSCSGCGLPPQVSETSCRFRLLCRYQLPIRMNCSPEFCKRHLSCTARGEEIRLLPTEPLYSAGLGDCNCRSSLKSFGRFQSSSPCYERVCSPERFLLSGWYCY